jgi:hypothetical protein
MNMAGICWAIRLKISSKMKIDLIELEVTNAIPFTDVVNVVKSVSPITEIKLLYQNNLHTKFTLKNVYASDLFNIGMELGGMTLINCNYEHKENTIKN